MWFTTSNWLFWIMIEPVKANTIYVKDYVKKRIKLLLEK